MKTIVFLVAETGTGKDTVVNKLPYPKLVSYTTRKMRNMETQGVDHIFITDEYMNELEKRDDLIAYTKTGDIRYCATTEQLRNDITIYIINPDGIRWFNNNYKGPTIRFITIGLYLPLEIRRSRCRIRSDFEITFEKRVTAEQQDYDNFRLNGEFDYLIKNEDSNKTAEIIYSIIDNEIKYHEYLRPVYRK